MHAGLGGLDRIVLVVRGACGAGKVENPVKLGVIGEGDVVADKFKIRIPDKVFDVPLLAGKEIVQADDVIFFFDEPVAEVAAEKPGTAGDEGASV
jgi:hypothetical protein